MMGMTYQEVKKLVMTNGAINALYAIENAPSMSMEEKMLAKDYISIMMYADSLGIDWTKANTYNELKEETQL